MKIVKRSTKLAKKQINNIMELMNIQNTIALLLTLTYQIILYYITNTNVSHYFSMQYSLLLLQSIIQHNKLFYIN